MVLGPSFYCCDTTLFSKLDSRQNICWTLTIKCCVAEPLVQTQLHAFPPTITASSHLSCFNNFGCRVCVQSACWEQKGSLTITTSILSTCKSEGEKGRKGVIKKKDFTFIIIIIIAICFCFENG